MKALFSLMLFCVMACAQAPFVDAKVSSVGIDLISVAADAIVTSSYGQTGGQQERVPQNPEPLPIITTEWVDTRGVTHSVATPVPSNTPAGMKRAMDTHLLLVSTMQNTFPPRP
jgi:hypothetical protein